jgi:hypothetical protein
MSKLLSTFCAHELIRGLVDVIVAIHGTVTTVGTAFTSSVTRNR